MIGPEQCAKSSSHLQELWVYKKCPCKQITIQLMRAFTEVGTEGRRCFQGCHEGNGVGGEFVLNSRLLFFQALFKVQGVYRREQNDSASPEKLLSYFGRQIHISSFSGHMLCVFLLIRGWGGRR